MECHCTGSKINVGSLLVHGNVQVKFNVSGSKSMVYNLSGRIQNDFGTKLAFGAGSFHFGMGDEKCGDARYSLCASGKVTIDGPSSFVFDAGFYTGAGATLKLGAGTSNSYIVGKSSGDNAIGLDGGSITVMANANTGKGVFRLNGDLNGGGGGSCVTIPASADHDISGNVNLAGGARLGAPAPIPWTGTSRSIRAAPHAASGKDVTIVLSGGVVFIILHI
ncbi:MULTISPECIES: hypothetical protein [Agrobacterium]|jgi:hypothetical protein|uniref:hypothetical protein n=1 Tax=Agrobacterium TaxID=357 RepID=UPI001CB7AC55|nr:MULTISPECIES: hypothetical protein [Agrobacterium]UNZ54150.1 hypothetical protein MLE07_25040 [Agrobacterium tumefaciens]